MQASIKNDSSNSKSVIFVTFQTRIRATLI